jgi:hypothetical protein
LWTVVLIGALYYFIALPAGYFYVGHLLDCFRGFGFECRPAVKRSPVQRARSAIALYQADNPGRCPTVEELVEGRYLLEQYAPVVEVRCEDGDVVVLGPGSSPRPLSERRRRQACWAWNLGGTIWAMPMRGIVWVWKAATGWLA